MKEFKKEFKELQLVSFEQAKRLKKLGFDWECKYYYSSFPPSIITKKTEKNI
jgi:hypothetical protein